jgi:hypothetical protein
MSLLCAQAIAGEIDLSFNSDAVRIFYLHDFDNSDLSADVGFVNHSDKGTVINGSLFVRGFASDGNNPLEAGLGLRAGYVDGKKTDQTGIPFAVGAFFRYALPAMDRVSVRGDVWFAPDILSLGDLDKYEDVSVRVQYALLREADIFIGARYLNTEFSNGSRALIDNGLNIGFNIRF